MLFDYLCKIIDNRSIRPLYQHYTFVYDTCRLINSSVEGMRERQLREREGVELVIVNCRKHVQLISLTCNVALKAVNAESITLIQKLTLYW